MADVDQDPLKDLTPEDVLAERVGAEHARTVALLVSRNGVILSSNRASAECLGGPRPGGNGVRLWGEAPEEAAESWVAPLRRVVAQGLSERLDMQLRGRWYDASLTPWLDSSGAVQGVALVGREITERKEAELALVRARAHYHDLLQTATDGIHVLNGQGELVEASASFYRMLGYAPRDPALRQVWDWDTQWSMYELRERTRRLMRSDQSECFETRHRCADGRTIEVEVSVRGIDREGQRYLYASSRDITERKRVEAALRESEERLRRLGDNLPFGMVYQVLGGEDGYREFVYVSAGVERVHGVNAEAVLRDAAVLYDQVAEEDRALLAAREEESIRARTPFRLEVRLRFPDGRVKWVYLTSAPTPLPDGRVRWDGVELDITEHRRLEERLRQSLKLEATGHLAGGIAHEFNNLLTAALMNLDLAHAVSGEGEAREAVEETLGQCHRAADLVKQLLALSQQSTIQLRPLDWAAWVRRQRDDLARLLGERVVLEIDAQVGLPPVHADPPLLEQVVLNLCLNAREAMPEGGRVALRLSEERVDSRHAQAHEEGRPGRFVCLSVADTGRGMDSATLQRLFEPFFTTKDVGQGPGLGLATVRGIVQQHRGWVEVESAVGTGSVFRVYLPAAEASVTGASADLAAGPAPGGGAVLLVEPNAMMRQSLRVLLVQHGYRVLEAGGAAEALRLAGAKWAEIGALFTAWALPGDLTGMQLAERLAARRPGLGAIVAGDGAPETSVGGSVAAAIVQVPRPCPASLLLSALQRVFFPSSFSRPGGNVAQ